MSAIGSAKVLWADLWRALGLIPVREPTDGAGWDGRPANPEQSAFHWVRMQPSTPLIAACWFAGPDLWLEHGRQLSPRRVVKLGWTYDSVCLTPDEVRALEEDLAAAQDALADFSAALAVVEEGGHADHRYLCDSTIDQLNKANAAIRARNEEGST